MLEQTLSFYVRSLFRRNLGCRKTHYENKPIQNILKILPPKNESFQMKYSKMFHISAQNIDCGYSLEPPDEAVLTSTHNLCFEQK